MNDPGRLARESVERQLRLQQQLNQDRVAHQTHVDMATRAHRNLQQQQERFMSEMNARRRLDSDHLPLSDMRRRLVGGTPPAPSTTYAYRHRRWYRRDLYRADESLSFLLDSCPSFSQILYNAKTETKVTVPKHYGLVRDSTGLRFGVSKDGMFIVEVCPLFPYSEGLRVAAAMMDLEFCGHVEFPHDVAEFGARGVSQDELVIKAIEPNVSEVGNFYVWIELGGASEESVLAAALSSPEPREFKLSLSLDGPHPFLESTLYMSAYKTFGQANEIVSVLDAGNLVVTSASAATLELTGCATLSHDGVREHSLEAILIPGESADTSVPADTNNVVVDRDWFFTAETKLEGLMRVSELEL
ncbi:hypothetical protein [Nocardioides euryhalodurans]|uniref:Uncharacterized protein n=1 Tax=Nocardioides euryhalodurans TaxID=2518370 RepID=A0A4P7GIY0_9ACTN|nr:hypothetical protein [Nocardioides euryhalodurans]QBR91823.1 hypothetical protein EXE57_05700 [Nocardioides euryhalodurans]